MRCVGLFITGDTDIPWAGGVGVGMFSLVQWQSVQEGIKTIFASPLRGAVSNTNII